MAPSSPSPPVQTPILEGTPSLPPSCFPCLNSTPLVPFWGKKPSAKLPRPLGISQSGAEQQTAQLQGEARREAGGKASPPHRGTSLNAPRCFSNGTGGFLHVCFQCRAHGAQGEASDSKGCPNSACAKGPCLMAFS